MSNTYELDTEVQLTISFLDSNGNPINPTTVVIFVQDPTQEIGEATQYTGGELSNPVVGTFAVAVLLGISGWWTYNGQGSGNVDVTTGDVRFSVVPSAVIPG